jgi:FtsH-binding integral membrane protein
MIDIEHNPLLVLVLSFMALWLAARLGVFFHGKDHAAIDGGTRDDFEVVLAATLTLLGLVIGFTFSMAINRYDQRKNYEEAEANAIGTEYVRANLLPAADASRVQGLLKQYLEQRVLFYLTDDDAQLRQIGTATARLQSELWSAVLVPAAAQPTPIVGLAVAGMNDVLNTQGYTQAAWWNRIPIAAWALMVAIAVCCCVLLGYGSRSTKGGAKLLLVLPLVVSIAFTLIADIDSPRHGLINVRPQNLDSLVESLRAQ